MGGNKMDDLDKLGEQIEELEVNEVNVPNFKIPNWKGKEVLMYLGFVFFSVVNTRRSTNIRRTFGLVWANIGRDGSMYFYTTTRMFMWNVLSTLLAIAMIVVGLKMSLPWFVAGGVILAIVAIVLFIFEIVFLGDFLHNPHGNNNFNSTGSSPGERLTALSIFGKTKDRIYKKYKKMVVVNNKVAESSKDILKQFSSSIVAGELDK